MVTGFKTAAAHTAVTAVILYRGTIDFGRLIYAAVTLDWTDLHEVSSTGRLRCDDARSNYATVRCSCRQIYGICLLKAKTDQGS